MERAERPGAGRAPDSRSAHPSPPGLRFCRHRRVIRPPSGAGRRSWGGPTAAALVPAPGVRLAEAQPTCASLPPHRQSGSRAGGPLKGRVRGPGALTAAGPPPRPPASLPRPASRSRLPGARPASARSPLPSARREPDRSRRRGWELGARQRARPGEMAEMGSKGVTAGKFASNMQKKLTRAQEKVRSGTRPATCLQPPGRRCAPGRPLPRPSGSARRAPRAPSGLRGIGPPSPTTPRCPSRALGFLRALTAPPAARGPGTRPGGRGPRNWERVAPGAVGSRGSWGPAARGRGRPWSRRRRRGLRGRPFPARLCPGSAGAGDWASFPGAPAAWKFRGTEGCAAPGGSAFPARGRGGGRLWGRSPEGSRRSPGARGAAGAGCWGTRARAGVRPRPGPRRLWLPHGIGLPPTPRPRPLGL